MNLYVNTLIMHLTNKIPDKVMIKVQIMYKFETTIIIEDPRVRSDGSEQREEEGVILIYTSYV